MINSTEYPNWHNLLQGCAVHNLRKACPNGNLTGILVAPKYFQLCHWNQHEAGQFSCLLYQIKQLPPPKKCFSTRKFFFKCRRFVWLSLFFMQNPATSSVNKISHKSQNFWSEIHCPCVESSQNAKPIIIVHFPGATKIKWIHAAHWHWLIVSDQMSRCF